MRLLLPIAFVLCLITAAHGQTLAETLGLNPELVQVTAEGLELTTEGEDGELAVQNVEGVDDQFLEFMPRANGFLSFSHRLSGGRIGFIRVSKFLDDRWQELHTDHSSSTWASGRYYIRVGLKLRIEFLILEGRQILDTFAFEALPEGDLAAAADIDVPFRNVGVAGGWISQTDDTYDGEDALRPVQEEEDSALHFFLGADLEATVAGPAVLSFWWKSGTDMSWRSLRLAITPSGTGIPASEWPSALSCPADGKWRKEILVIPEGEHTLHWIFELPYSGAQPTAALDQIRLEPIPAPAPLVEGMESDLLEISDATTGEWRVLNTDKAADGEDLVTTATSGGGTAPRLKALVQGPAIIDFYWSTPGFIGGMYFTTNESDPTAWTLGDSYHEAERLSLLDERDQWSQYDPMERWRPARVFLPPGDVLISWGVSPFSSNGSGYYDSVMLDDVSVSPIEVVPLEDALGSSGLAFETGPEGHEWWGQLHVAHDEDGAAMTVSQGQSGDAWLWTVVDGPGRITYRAMRVEDSASSTTYSHNFTIALGRHTPDGTVWVEETRVSVASDSFAFSELLVPAGRHDVLWKVSWAASDGWNYEDTSYAHAHALDDITFIPKPIGSPFRASVEVDGWMWSPWFSWYFQMGSWVHHPEHGWLYSSGTADNSVFLYDTSLGSWLWTAEGLYPTVYRFSDGEWYAINPGDGIGQRWFYRYGDGEWVKEPEL